MFCSLDLFRRFVLVLCAQDPEVLKHVDVERVALRSQQFAKNLPVFFSVLVQVCILILEYSLPPLAWKWRRCSNLSSEKQAQYLERNWQNHRWYWKRTVYRLAVSVCLSNLYSEIELLKSIGYAGALEHRLGAQPPRAPRTETKPL